MKRIVYFIGLGLFLMVGAVGCEEFEEHEHHEGHGGAYDGNYQGYGHDYRAYPDDDYYRH
jgi:hypothetical protein